MLDCGLREAEGNLNPWPPFVSPRSENNQHLKMNGRVFIQLTVRIMAAGQEFATVKLSLQAYWQDFCRRITVDCWLCFYQTCLIRTNLSSMSSTHFIKPFPDFSYSGRLSIFGFWNNSQEQCQIGIHMAAAKCWNLTTCPSTGATFLYASATRSSDCRGRCSGCFH